MCYKGVEIVLPENKNLIDFRKNLIKTQDQMATELDVSTSFYIKIESGERNPSFNFMRKLKDKHNDVSIDELFFSSK